VSMGDFPLQQAQSELFPALERRPPRPGLLPVLVAYWVIFILLHLSAGLLCSRDGVFLWFYPAALSVALLLTYGPRVLPAVFVAALPVDFLGHSLGLGPWAMVGMSLAYGCGHALAVWGFRRFGFSPRLRRVRDVTGFLLLIFLGPLLASFPAYLILRHSGALQGLHLVDDVRVILLGDALGVLTLAPALLLWVRPLLVLGWKSLLRLEASFRLGEFLLQCLALVFSAWVVVRFSEPGTLHLKYLLFLPMTWLVMRGGLAAASLGFPVLTLALTALILRAQVHGEAILGIQAFLLLLFGTALFLAAAISAQEAALRVRDRRSRHLGQLLEGSGAIPWEMDLDTGRCGYLGHSVEEVLKRPVEAWRKEPFWGDVIHPDDRLGFLKFLSALGRPDADRQIEFRLSEPDGGGHWVRAAGGLEPGHAKGRVVGFLFDIHSQKEAEENVLKASLREKDLLLREIHHRVKNNLQVVSSLLRLQASNAEPALQRALQEAQERVQAIALIHHKLKHAPNFSEVDLPDYVRTLAERLVRTYASVPALIDLRVQVAEVDLGPDAPVPLGLILNELVSNALQHAFPPGQGGSLDIEIDQDARGWITLRVADSGQGLPPDQDLDSGGLGFQLVKALTDQLGGLLEIERRRGASFLLTFPPSPQRP